MHSSIEYWECPCRVDIGKEYRCKKLRQRCNQQDYGESVELLTSPDNQDWVIWELHSDYGDYQDWFLRDVGVSEIVI